MLCCFLSFASSQTKSAPVLPKDNLAFPKDTLAAESDSLKAAVADSAARAEGGIDSTVTYTAADSIIFTFDNKMMNIFGKGDVQYRDLSLKAERINVNWNTNDLESFGVLDTAKAIKSDSLKARYSGTPVMVEGADNYKGWKIAYNFKSQQGRVTLGETAEDQGYYQGQQIKKVDKDMLFISNGYYSTCEYGHPHFYFYSPSMRVTVRDKIVARPIYLYIADVPIFALPFGVFPSQGGRRSGIIAPAFVDKGAQGTGLEHFGYYFALNDYMDAAVVGNWLTGGTWRASPNLRYVKRYDLSGSLSGYYQHTYQNEPRDGDYVDRVDYAANIMHDQAFDPTTRLSVNFAFMSSENYKSALTRNEYLNQDVTSNATLSKGWEGTNNSMSVNISRRQDLVTGTLTNTLPNIAFNHSQSYPFRFGKNKGGSDENRAWYEMIGMNYGANYLRYDNRSRSADSIPFTYFKRDGINHTLSLNASPKAGYITVSPYFNYYEKWYDQTQEIGGYDSNGFAIARDRNGFAAVRSFATGLTFSTKLYGMLQPPIPGVAGFRHTLQPSLTYTYHPDFSEKQWGYFIPYTDSFGRAQKFNRFQKEIFGGVTPGEEQSLGISIGNNFEMKTAPKDTADKGTKLQLLNVGLTTNYNFVEDSLRLAPLSVSYRTDIGQYLSISGSSAYNFYEYDQTARTRVNRFLANSGTIAQMTSVSVTLSTSLSGEKKKAQTQQDVEDSTRVAENQRNMRASGYKGIYDTPEPDFSIPWSLSLNFSFAQYQENPRVKTRSVNINGNLDFNLTENWKFTASTGYDLVSKQLAAPAINISRDLHCWLMNFSWNPLGPYAGYRFEIKVKAPQLQDIKVTKQNNERL